MSRMPLHMPPSTIPSGRNNFHRDPMSSLSSSVPRQPYDQQSRRSRASSTGRPVPMTRMEVAPRRSRNSRKRDFRRSPELQATMDRIQQRREREERTQSSMSSPSIPRGHAKTQPDPKVEQVLEMMYKYDVILNHLVRKNKGLRHHADSGQSVCYPSNATYTTNEVLDTLQDLRFQREKTFGVGPAGEESQTDTRDYESRVYSSSEFRGGSGGPAHHFYDRRQDIPRHPAHFEPMDPRGGLPPMGGRPVPSSLRQQGPLETVFSGEDMPQDPQYMEDGYGADPVWGAPPMDADPRGKARRMFEMMQGFKEEDLEAAQWHHQQELQQQQQRSVSAPRPGRFDQDSYAQPPPTMVDSYYHDSIPPEYSRMQPPPPPPPPPPRHSQSSSMYRGPYEPVWDGGEPMPNGRGDYYSQTESSMPPSSNGRSEQNLQQLRQQPPPPPPPPPPPRSVDAPPRGGPSTAPRDRIKESRDRLAEFRRQAKNGKEQGKSSGPVPKTRPDPISPKETKTPELALKAAPTDRSLPQVGSLECPVDLNDYEEPSQAGGASKGTRTSAGKSVGKTSQGSNRNRVGTASKQTTAGPSLRQKAIQNNQTGRTNLSPKGARMEPSETAAKSASPINRLPSEDHESEFTPTEKARQLRSQVDKAFEYSRGLVASQDQMKEDLHRIMDLYQSRSESMHDRAIRATSPTPSEGIGHFNPTPRKESPRRRITRKESRPEDQFPLDLRPAVDLSRDSDETSGSGLNPFVQNPPRSNSASPVSVNAMPTRRRAPLGSRPGIGGPNRSKGPQGKLAAGWSALNRYDTPNKTSSKKLTFRDSHLTSFEDRNGDFVESSGVSSDGSYPNPGNTKDLRNLRNELELASGSESVSGHSHRFAGNQGETYIPHRGPKAEIDLSFLRKDPVKVRSRKGGFRSGPRDGLDDTWTPLSNCLF